MSDPDIIQMQREANEAMVNAQRAQIAAEKAQVMLQARMVDMKAAKREHHPELCIRANRNYDEAQEEYVKCMNMRDAMMSMHEKLTTEVSQVTTQRELSRFGSLGRFPSNSNLRKSEEVAKAREDPWFYTDGANGNRGGRPKIPFRHLYLAPLPIGNRRRVAKFYNKYMWEHSIGIRNESIQCVVTDEWSTGNDIVVSRILPLTTSKNILTRLGLKRRDVNNPRNMLIVARNIKQYFDECRLTFLLHDEGIGKEERLGLCFRMHVWDNSILTKPIFKGSKLTVGDFDGKVFFFFSDEKTPFLRALSYHAQRSYESAKRRGDFRFFPEKDIRPVEYGCPLPYSESITCSDPSEDDVDDDLSAASSDVWSVDTENLPNPTDYPILND